MSRFVYTGKKLKEISFPIGGIGTGSIGLSGTGRFKDWEIFNRPNKGRLNGFTHFSVKIEEAGKVVDARVMNSDLHPPFMGEMTSQNFNGYGFGPSRYSLSGVPHFNPVTEKSPSSKLPLLTNHRVSPFSAFLGLRPVVRTFRSNLGGR